MRVLIVHNFYQIFGGEDAAALADQQLLARRGVAHHLYSRHNDEIHAYGPARKIAFARDAVRSERTVKDIDRLVDSFRPTVAYAHNVFPLISPAVYDALADRGVPIVQVMHDFRFFCLNGWYYTHGSVCERCRDGAFHHGVRLRCYRNSLPLSAIYAASIGRARRRNVLDRITTFVCPGPFMMRKLGEAGPWAERAVIKPHFFDSKDLEPDFGPGGYMLFMGRLSAEKGLLTLLDAFARLPDIKLKIAGGGRLEPQLRERIRNGNLSNVELVGFVEGEGKARLLREASALIVPSECYETFGIAVLEAHAAGKPVIASDIGSLPDLVEDGQTGLLCRPRDPAHLAEQARRLAADPALRERMGRLGRSRVESEYNPDRNADLLVDILSRAERSP